ncbi:Lonely Guy (LOG) family (PpnN) (PDB:2PMB) (PUBMED:25728768 [Commensalibacter communis]|uniref:LOG family protein n=1 Tax=Commensalibacter communis TaxID=2972786 RepID=UPI0022FF617D|nr:TIGR00730 family Rossman fold protein [Commensalibacter communis]CAI3938199.1 Lonely Guy (LOG) family (PpnN) (PDB:2PMB) (PUBMED:25728768 [Commensalibacter communis]
MSTYTHSVTVFCGSHLGNNPAFEQAGKDLGKGLVQNNIRLVFGGGNVGIMGAVSNTVIDLNGAVKGIIPKFLQKKEGEHSRVQDLIVTQDMHKRKEILYQEADAFLCLPGGIGTFDEFFEILTWKQLHLHNKPIIIVNIENWAEQVCNQLKAIVDQGFADAGILNLFELIQDVPTTLNRLQELFD